MATIQKDQTIYDARTLGSGKMMILGLQHLFAMFGATILVPVITGLSVSATLLFAGIGTLIFHLCTKMKVPAFLGSSFAFLGGYAAVTQMGMAKGMTLAQSLPYACIGVFCAGFMYFVLAGLFAAFGAKKVMRFFPPVVTGPIIIAIGLTLSGSAIQNCSQNWWIAILSVARVLKIVYPRRRGNCTHIADMLHHSCQGNRQNGDYRSHYQTPVRILENSKRGVSPGKRKSNPCGFFHGCEIHLPEARGHNVRPEHSEQNRDNLYHPPPPDIAYHYYGYG